MLGLVLCPGEQKHSTGAECREDWSTANAGSFGASSSGSRSATNRTVLMVLPPHRRRAWCPVLFLAGFMLPWTRFWVLGPLRTRLKMNRLSAQMGPLPCGRDLLRAPSPVLLGYLLWESRLLWKNCGVPGHPRTGFPQLHLSACWWGWIGQVTQLGWHLTLTRLRGSHPRPRQMSARLRMTTLMSWPRLVLHDSVTWDRDTPLVKATGAVTSAGPAGIKQPGVMNLGQRLLNLAAWKCWQLCNKHWGCLQCQIIMTWHLPRTFALETFQ